MRKKDKGMLLLAMAVACVGTGGFSAEAAFDENLDNYTLDTVVVEATALKNQFGDTITEQSYYRTGGDVKVITREEIEKRHYTDLTEAIKRIPGVTFQNPGYRGGEYGYEFYNNGVAINGDTRVIILVDGRRVDNAASTRISKRSTSGSKSTGVNLDQVTNMESVEKIEVIKGPGASVYGADATGGVINIITRKGGLDSYGSVDLSTGSWGKHNYAVSFSGAAGDDKSLRYFVSANRNMSGNSKFKDGTNGQVAELPISAWKEDGVNISLEKQFDDNQSLSIWYNHKNGVDGYPVATPRLQFWNEKDWYRILFEVVAGKYDENNKIVEKGKAWTDMHQPGYHNIYLARALNDVKSEFNNNDLSITYTFKKVNGMDSFIRLYNQQHTYRTRSYFAFFKKDGKYLTSIPGLYDLYTEKYPNGTTDENLMAFMKEYIAPFPAGTDIKRIEEWKKGLGNGAPVTDWHQEKNRGIELQYADTWKNHDVIAGVVFDKATERVKKKNRKTGGIIDNTVSRDSWKAFIQDKIHITDDWDLTPSVRYSRYSAYTDTDESNPSQGKGSTNALTYAVNTQYLLDDTTSVYLGWTSIFRPIRIGDYSANTGIYKTPLKDEKGNAWTLGVRKELSEKTSLGVHYSLVKMSNAIATLPIWDKDSDEFKRTALNAKEDKKSFNVTLDHRFNDHFLVSASYSHMDDKWMAKEGWILDPDWEYSNSSDINTAINTLRPQNHYSLNLSYEKGKLYTGLLINWYTGNNTKAFSSKRFLVMDWNANYQITDNMNLYLLVSNLTNEAYETAYNSRNGIAAAAMPARSVLLGAKYTF